MDIQILGMIILSLSLFFYPSRSCLQWKCQREWGERFSVVEFLTAINHDYLTEAFRRAVYFTYRVTTLDHPRSPFFPVLLFPPCVSLGHSLSLSLSLRFTGITFLNGFYVLNSNGGLCANGLVDRELLRAREAIASTLVGTRHDIFTQHVGDDEIPKSFRQYGLCTRPVVSQGCVCHDHFIPNRIIKHKVTK